MGKLVSGAIIAFWLVMMGLLFQKEVSPQLVLGSASTYRKLLSAERKYEPMRMGIYALAKRVGVSDSSTRVEADGSYHLKNVTKIDVAGLSRHLRKVWRERLQVKATTEMEVSSQGKLRRFRMEVDSPLLTARLSGIVEGEELVFTVETPEQVVTHRIPYDPEVVLTTSLNPFAEFHDLEVGQRWQVGLLSPRTLELTFATIEVMGVGTTNYAGSPVNYFQLQTELEGFPVEGWVSEQGQLLRIVVPPLLLIREPIEDDRTKRSDQDLR